MEVASPAGADLSGLPFSASLSILQIFAALLPVTFNLYALPFPSTRGSPNSAKSLRSLPCHNPSRLLCISLERDIARSDSTIPIPDSQTIPKRVRTLGRGCCRAFERATRRKMAKLGDGKGSTRNRSLVVPLPAGSIREIAG